MLQQLELLLHASQQFTWTEYNGQFLKKVHALTGYILGQRI